MITLNDKETINYIGGAKITAGFAVIFSAIASFVLGFIDGLTNPKACNSK